MKSCQYALLLRELSCPTTVRRNAPQRYHHFKHRAICFQLINAKFTLKLLLTGNHKFLLPEKDFKAFNNHGNPPIGNACKTMIPVRQPYTKKDALQYFHQLLACKNPTPSINSFTQIFTFLTRMKNSNNHYKTIFTLFNLLTQPKGVSASPDACSYTILIDYCTQINRPEHGWIFFGRFIREELRADPLIFSPILRGLCSQNRIGEAVAMVLDKMPRLGCAPDVICYHIIINGLCKIGAISQALGLLSIMLSDGIAPDVFTYSSLIDGLCKEGEIKQAWKLFCDMVSQGLQPDTMTYNTLMDGFWKMGLLNKAVDMLQCMVSEGLNPSVVTYNTVIISTPRNSPINNIQKQSESY